jgi:hypothetical protein
MPHQIPASSWDAREEGGGSISRNKAHGLFWDRGVNNGVQPRSEKWPRQAAGSDRNPGFTAEDPDAYYGVV